jgi:CRISPR-associated endonuclease/helicase Cas3
MRFKPRKETEPASPGITAVPALDECLAKTRKVFTAGEEPQYVPGCTVEQHCEAVGEIAKSLLSLLPDFLVSRLFPAGSVLTAAVHDCGKVSPQFFFKIQNAVGNGDEVLKKYPYLQNYSDKSKDEFTGKHSGVGYATLLRLKHESSAVVIGQHHGYLTRPNALAGTSESGMFGGPEWERRREELIKRLAVFFSEKLPDTLSAEQICALSGLTCVADWIGSGSCFEDAGDGPVTRELVQKAIAVAGFRKLQIIPGLGFKEIFGFEPNPVQSALCSQCRKTGRGVYVLEAPMGTGKTEAALYVAYKLLEANEATGIYFALPTRLTSDRIYDRFTGFIRKILKDPENYFPMLLHGDNFLQMHELRKKWLGGMGVEGEPGNSWFDSSKRGLLARFAVGTVDQALLAVMNVKHAFVRDFGLAGKVVILDEVHSYDMYTGTLIKELVDRLIALGSTVIILSATLTCSKKRQLLGGETEDEAKERAYPLISCKKTDDSRISVCPVFVASSESTVSFGFHSQDDCLKEAVERARTGQQVLWIENTVNDAQEIFRRLSPACSAAGIECGLLHSKFIPQDRFEKENRWTAVLGKDPGERSGQGRILVGTQVLEQSLDIDADFMVSRFAPADMLLQRSGRLWRHRFIKRPEGARQELWLIEPEADDAAEKPLKAFGASASVYWPYILCRSLEAFKNRCRGSTCLINLPEDIRPLLEDTYRDRKEDQNSSTSLGELYREMIDGKRVGGFFRPGITALRTKALSHLSDNGIFEPDDDAATRYSPGQEAETGIIIVKDWYYDAQRNLNVYKFLDGTEIEIRPNSRFAKKEDIADLALRLKENTVMCRSRYLPGVMTVSAACRFGLDCLYYSRKDPTQPFPFLLMQAGDDYPSTLSAVGMAMKSDKFDIRYSRHLGLETKKIDG